MATTAPASGPLSAPCAPPRATWNCFVEMGPFIARPSDYLIIRNAYLPSFGAFQSVATVSAPLTNLQINPLFKAHCYQSPPLRGRALSGGCANGCRSDQASSRCRRLQHYDSHHAQPAQAAWLRTGRRCQRWLRRARQTAQARLRPGHFRLEHGADDGLRTAEGNALRSFARRNSLHHGHGGIENRERGRRQASRRVELHRQTIQRADAEDED